MALSYVPHALHQTGVYVSCIMCLTSATAFALEVPRMQEKNSKRVLVSNEQCQ